MNRVEFDEKLCKGCELCVSACPKKILHLSDRTNAMGYRVAECFRPEACIACAFCATMCPDCVITVYKAESKRHEKAV